MNHVVRRLPTNQDRMGYGLGSGCFASLACTLAQAYWGRAGSTARDAASLAGQDGGFWQTSRHLRSGAIVEIALNCF
jgi:hypothetical protein